MVNGEIKERGRKVLEHERKLIHLLLTGKINPSDIENECPPKAFDPHHQLLVESIYREFRDIGTKLTRNRYRQALSEARADGDLMQNLTVWDKCFAQAYATADEIGELKKDVIEGYFARQVAFSSDHFKSRAAKDGFQIAFQHLKQDLDRASIALTSNSLDIMTIADVEEKAIDWLWQGRIALGKICLLVGDPGSGKTFCSLDIAARITKGNPFPGETIHNKPGDVLILSSEDAADDTLKPRLRMQGADLNRVHVINGIKGSFRSFSFDIDLPMLENALKQFPAVKMLIVDPINAYLGSKTDSYKDADIRRVLGPLAKFADEHRIAVLAITHMTKSTKSNAIYRAIGSIGFTGQARTSFIITTDKDDPDRRLFLVNKNNISADGNSGLAFRLVKNKGLVWDDQPVTISADEALSSTDMPRVKAKEWLLDHLEDGPVRSAELETLAKSQGISFSTLQRAKKELGIVSRQIVDHWEWSLPNAAVKTDKNQFADKG